MAINAPLESLTYTAAALERLAQFYSSQQQFAKAEPLLVRALAIREKGVSGPEHLDTAATLGRLAQLYSSQQQYAKAEPLLQEALAIYEKDRGPGDLGNAAYHQSLEEVYRDQGRYDRAEVELERALTIIEKERGPEAVTGSRLRDLVRLYFSQGQRKKAEQLLDRILMDAESSFGSDDVRILPVLSSLASEQYFDAKNSAVGVGLLEQAFSIAEKKLGPDR